MMLPIYVDPGAEPRAGRRGRRRRRSLSERTAARVDGRRRSCSRAECSRWSAPAGSPATPVRISTGGGRRLPRNVSWPRPPTSLPSRHRRRRPPAAPGSRSSGAGSRQRRRQSPTGRRDRAGSRRRPRSRRRAVPRDASDLARLSRTRSRRRRPRRADRDRLGEVAAGRAVAPADRPGLVLLRGPRRSPLHPGAARRRRRSSPATA